MLRATLRLNVSTGLVASAAAAGQYTTRCESQPQRRVTPVRELERDVIVLERQVAGEPLKRINLEEMIEDLADPSRKLVMFGEHHDDAKAQDVGLFMMGWLEGSAILVDESHWLWSLSTRTLAGTRSRSLRVDRTMLRNYSGARATRSATGRWRFWREL
jgi:hypothetical protein